MTVNNRFLQTTVPKEIAEEITRLAEDQLVTRAAVMRQILIRTIRQLKKENAVSGSTLEKGTQ